MHIAVAGNIGSGKTTLTRMLARHYGWEARFEAVDHNPYLEDYYRDIHRWSFNLEVYFLKERFRDLIDIQSAAHTVVQDRSIFEGVYVFMQNNKAMGNLTEKYGPVGSPQRKEFQAKAEAWYFSELLRDERKRQKLTQQELGERIGKKREYISSLERGKTDMQLSTFMLIAKALGLKFSLVIG